MLRTITQQLNNQSLWSHIRPNFCYSYELLGYVTTLES